MMYLVDKSALVAEIEKRLQANEAFDKVGDEARAEDVGMCNAYKSILSFLDTFKAKEVDLEREIKSSMDNLCELGCYAQSLVDNPGDYEGFAKPFPKEVNDEIANFAKHFFELGLKAQNGGLC